jgi:cytoskeletal protein RodZ
LWFYLLSGAVVVAIVIGVAFLSKYYFRKQEQNEKDELIVQNSNRSEIQMVNVGSFNNS